MKTDFAAAKCGLIAFVLALCMLVSVPVVSADVYKYVDQDGTIIYTDDITQVPASQRETSLEIKEPEKTDSATVASDTDAATPKVQPALKGSAGMSKSQKELELQQEQLTREHEALKLEVTELENEKKAASTRKEISEYNLKTEALNIRIKAYQEKQAEFIEKVNAYNQSVADDTGSTETAEQPDEPQDQSAE
jgi:hypothetical protein